MKYKKGLLIICLIICLFSIASVCASDVNETVVASENDEVMSVENGHDSSAVDHLDATDELNIETADEPEASAVQKNFTDIQNLIDAADDGDTINLTGNYINLDKKYIELNKSITLDGKGQTILDGNSEVLFNISKPNVKLINIKFVNVEGNANGSINWQGDYGSIENCTFMNVNFTVILWQGNHGSLVDCEFEKSYKALQIIHWMGNYSSIRSCRFKNMDTYGQYAGTIAMWGNNSLISNCSFTNSTSNRYGGAICLMGDNGTVESSEFINCYSSYGGAITVGTPYSTVDNCSFQDCSSHNMGGAVYWAGGYGNLTNSEFQNCSCYSSGGAVTWQAIDGNIINCTFNECSANNQGGTIYWGYNNGRVENCKFSNLYSRTTTSAIQWFGAYGVLRNSTFINCSSSEYLLGAGVVFTYGHFHLMENCSFINCSSDYAYGVAYISGDFSKVDDCSFINCHCKDLGGALRCDDSVVSNSRFIDCYSNTGGSVYAIDSNVTGCYFENSHAVNGGAICAIGNYIFINISDCQFVNTTAVKGGAISVFKANCNLSACSFVNSTAENGGAVYLADSNVSANKLLFSNVCCQNFGDLIYTESYLDIRNSVLQPIDLVGDRHVIYANNTDIKACENWWGGNENPSNLVNFDAFHTHDLSQWIVTDELKLNDGEISIDFNHLMNDDGNMTEFAADLPAFEIEASVVNGSFAKDKTLVKNGIATFTFNQNGERDVLTFACNSAKWYFAIGQKYNVPTRLSVVRYYSPDNNLILFNISLYDEEDNLISDSVIVSLNGNRNHVTLSNGSAEAISMNNTDEDYLILIRYEGNWKYLPSELMFSKDNPFVAIEAPQSSHNEKLVVT
ncbi:MAG: hypothetical protein VZR10_07330, partial [Methanobrevibacter sp.]|nr:hypothetical protein [Methanobrevibacter sp.]